MSALVQQTPEWLELRKNKIGASDAPVIMEVSPWATPLQLWETKLGFRFTNQTVFMKYGLVTEEAARQAFEQKTGHIVFPAVLFHKEHDWMMASLDGIDIEHKIVVEIKCPGQKDHELALKGSVPDKYYPQLQHQIEVAGVDFAYYWSYTGQSSALIKVDRNQPYIDDMLKKESDFYQCMMDLEAPAMIERDFVDMNDDIWLETAKKWAHVNTQLKSLERIEKDLRSTLIHMAGKSNCKGGGIRLSRSMRKGSIDYAGIDELRGIDLEPYRKPPVESWRLTQSKE